LADVGACGQVFRAPKSGYDERMLRLRCGPRRPRAGRAVRTALLWCALVAVVVVSTRARADEPSADRIATAAKEYDEGRRLYLESKYEEAAVHFEKAFVGATRREPLRH